MLDHMVLHEVYDMLYQKYVLDSDADNVTIYDILDDIKDMYLENLDEFEKSYGGTE